LALGAIANGCNSVLKQHLNALIPFLTNELQNPNKMVRAISSWTLSRFTKFIMVENISENANEIFKSYLCETLKRFLDKEVIVQDPACTAFTTMIQTKKEKLEPYLLDIFQIVTKVVDIYQETSLFTLYNIISLLGEHFELHFKNTCLVEELVKCIVNKWYTMLNAKDYSYITPVFDIICTFIKITNIMSEFLDDFINGSLSLLENNISSFSNANRDINSIDREVISKSIDLISVICQIYPNKLKQSPQNFVLVEYCFQLLTTGDSFVVHHVVALLGEITNVEPELIKPHFEKSIEILIKCLEIPTDKYDSLDMEKFTLCNNSSWTISIFIKHFGYEVNKYTRTILNSLLKILGFPKVKL
jgi:transportin-1